MAFDPVIFENSETVNLSGGQGGHGTSRSGPFSRPDLPGPGDLPNMGVVSGQITVPPRVPNSSEASAQGTTAVNVVAMRTFAKNLRTLADGPLSGIQGQLDQVQIKPGWFDAAYEKVVNPITGEGGLRDSIRTSVQDLYASLHDAADAVEAAARSYESSDDLNAMSADAYQKYFGSVGTEINGIGGKGA